MIKYTENHTIPCYATDAAWRLRPTSFMNMAQEAAGRHAVQLGFGYDDLIKTNTAWILSRVHVEFIDAPKWREEVTLNTWHKGLNRLFFLRDFVIVDNEGRERVKATTSWLVLNLETRRLVRDPKLIEEGTICTENALETPADKVQMPKDVEPEFVLEHVVSYSDIDTNGHTPYYIDTFKSKESSYQRPSLLRFQGTNIVIFLENAKETYFFFVFKSFLQDSPYPHSFATNVCDG